MGCLLQSFNVQLKGHLNKYKSVKSQEKVKYFLLLLFWLLHQESVLNTDLV